MGEIEPGQFRVDDPRIAGIWIEVLDCYSEELGQHLRGVRGRVLPGARTEL